jgi:hypothetical protein
VFICNISVSCCSRTLSIEESWMTNVVRVCESKFRSKKDIESLIVPALRNGLLIISKNSFLFFWQWRTPFLPSRNDQKYYRTWKKQICSKKFWPSLLSVWRRVNEWSLVNWRISNIDRNKSSWFVSRYWLQTISETILSGWTQREISLKSAIDMEVISSL